MTLEPGLLLLESVLLIVTVTLLVIDIRYISGGLQCR
jgi:hypothetical protein